MAFQDHLKIRLKLALVPDIACLIDYFHSETIVNVSWSLYAHSYLSNLSESLTVDCIFLISGRMFCHGLYMLFTLAVIDGKMFLISTEDKGKVKKKIVKNQLFACICFLINVF